MTEDEMIGWHHRLYGQEFEQTLGDSEEQGSLVCSSPWGLKELDTTERLNNNNLVKTKKKRRAKGILTYMQSTSCEMQGWMKLESRLPGEISMTSNMQMTSP